MKILNLVYFSVLPLAVATGLMAWEATRVVPVANAGSVTMFVVPADQEADKVDASSAAISRVLTHLAALDPTKGAELPPLPDQVEDARSQSEAWKQTIDHLPALGAAHQLSLTITGKLANRQLTAAQLESLREELKGIAKPDGNHQWGLEGFDRIERRLSERIASAKAREKIESQIREFKDALQAAKRDVDKSIAELWDRTAAVEDVAFSTPLSRLDKVRESLGLVPEQNGDFEELIRRANYYRVCNPKFPLTVSPPQDIETTKRHLKVLEKIASQSGVVPSVEHEDEAKWLDLIKSTRDEWKGYLRLLEFRERPPEAYDSFFRECGQLLQATANDPVKREYLRRSFSDWVRKKLPPLDRKSPDSGVQEVKGQLGNYFVGRFVEVQGLKDRYKIYEWQFGSGALAANYATRFKTEFDPADNVPRRPTEYLLYDKASTLRSNVVVPGTMSERKTWTEFQRQCEGIKVELEGYRKIRVGKLFLSEFNVDVEIEFAKILLENWETVESLFSR
jgi:hypothetical protein